MRVYAIAQNCGFTSLHWVVLHYRPLCLLSRFGQSRCRETRLVRCGATDEGGQFLVLHAELQDEVKEQPRSGIIQPGLASVLQAQILRPQLAGRLHERRWTMNHTIHSQIIHAEHLQIHSVSDRCSCHTEEWLLLALLTHFRSLTPQRVTQILMGLWRFLEYPFLFCAPGWISIWGATLKLAPKFTAAIEISTMMWSQLIAWNIWHVKRKLEMS